MPITRNLMLGGLAALLAACATAPGYRGATAAVDRDADGVADPLDRCPLTPAGARVDRDGCELDSDCDGVADGRDRCPRTAAGRGVDAQGCEPLLGTAGALILHGVNFASDSDRLSAGAMQVLDGVAAELAARPQLRVEVAGHTDARNTEAYNLDLSQRRARAVVDYLASRGIDATRLQARGYGEGQPLADNHSPEGMQRNRRVELRPLPETPAP